MKKNVTPLSNPPARSPYSLLAQGVRFLADEALETALRYYRESRELCVDLAADEGDDERLRGFPGSSDGAATDFSPAGTEAAACGALLRAEYNVGMALVEREEHGDAVRHLSAVGDRFWELFAKLSPDKEPSGDRGAAAHRGPFTVAVLACLGAAGGEGGGGGGGGKGRRRGAVGEGACKAPWSAAVLDREGFSDLGGLYASSLFLLGECLARCPSSSFSPSLPPLVEARRASVLSSAAENGATLSASRQAANRSQHAAVVAENPRAHLNAAAETLEASAEAFLAVDDAAGALDSLAKLVEVLETIADENEEHERDFSSLEMLCDQASARLMSRGDGVCDGESRRDKPGVPTAPARNREESCDILETESLDRVREGIERLRTSLGRGARCPKRDLEARGQGDPTQGEATGEKELSPLSAGIDGHRQQQQQQEEHQQEWQEDRERRRRQQQQLQDNGELGNSANASTSSRSDGGDAAVGSTGGDFGVRVGPLPTAGFAQRRKRQRALSLAPTLVGVRGISKAVSLAGHRPAASSGTSDPATASLMARAGEQLPRAEGGSFAAMRAVVAAAGGAAAAAASAIVAGGDRPRGDPGAVGGGREDHATAMLASYRRTVRQKAAFVGARRTSTSRAEKSGAGCTLNDAYLFQRATFLFRFQR